MVVVGFQQAANHRSAHGVPLRIELFLQIVQTAIEPFGVVHRIARRMGLD